MANGVGLRLQSLRGSWVRIPPPAPTSPNRRERPRCVPLFCRGWRYSEILKNPQIFTVDQNMHDDESDPDCHRCHIAPPWDRLGVAGGRAHGWEQPDGQQPDVHLPRWPRGARGGRPRSLRCHEERQGYHRDHRHPNRASGALRNGDDGGAPDPRVRRPRWRVIRII